MKDLLSKEHDCYKIHSLLMKSKSYPFIWTPPNASIPTPPHPTPPHPTFAKKSLYPFNVTATGLEPRTTWLVNEHSTIWPNFEQGVS